MKKFLSVISILMVVSMLAGVFGAAGVNAAESLYTARDVTAYVFGLENTKTITGLFRSDLPDVMYIDPVDYLSVIFTETFMESASEDGTYTVVTESNNTMVIDPENDTVTFDCFDSFLACDTNSEGSSIEITYVGYVDSYYSVEPSAVVIDLASYNIDIAEAGGKVYLPLPVIAAMFSETYNNAVYVDGKLYFVHSMENDSYIYDVDFSSLYDELTRMQDMADFNYNTLCLYFDCFYGHPSNALLADLINEEGFDKALDDFDEYTVLAKQLLKSTDMVEYFDGLIIANYYCYDGGHTVVYIPPIEAVNNYSDLPLGQAWLTHFLDKENELSLTTNAFYSLILESYADDTVIAETREAEYEKYEDEIVKTWEDTGSYLIVHGDTAVYVFDSFEQDTPYEFKEALDLAKECGVKNFLLDDSCNGGGLVVACEFICTMISKSIKQANEYGRGNKNELSDSVFVTKIAYDLNLDGVINELDDEVLYDFNFGVLCSKMSFSCGNTLPVCAAHDGLMVIGQRSGGGSCYITDRYLADGTFIYISDVVKAVMDDGGDLDLGAPVAYDLTATDEEGNTDYSGLYDIDRVSELFDEYYYRTVKFVDYDGTVLSETKYHIGDTVKAPDDPARESDGKYAYSFKGWDTEVAAICTESAEYKAIYGQFVPGDINGDENVDNKDVVVLFRYLSGSADTEINEVALDVNGDSAVDNKDVVILFRFLSGSGVELSTKPYIPA